MVLIPFLHAVPPEKQIPQLYKKLLEEAPYIVRESVYAYQKLMRNNFVLTRSEVPNEYLPGEARETVSAVQSFLNEHCVFDPDASTSTERLYQVYTKKAPGLHSQHMTKIAFSRILANILSNRNDVYEVKRSENSDRRGYRGIRLVFQEDKS